MALRGRLGQDAPMWLAFSMIITLAWPTAAERNDAVETIKLDKDLQRSLPSTPARKQPTPEEAQARRERRRSRSQSSTREERELKSDIAGTILWILLGIVGIAVAVVIGRELMQRPAVGKPVANDPALPPPDPLRIEAGTLDDAERLARDGRFAEAIHVLLLRTFDDIGRQAALPKAFTSREILARVRTADDARQALGHLVTSVELCIFGGAEPGADDYARCRASFERVLGAKGIEVV